MWPRSPIGRLASQQAPKMLKYGCEKTYAGTAALGCPASEARQNGKGGRRDFNRAEQIWRSPGCKARPSAFISQFSSTRPACHLERSGDFTKWSLCGIEKPALSEAEGTLHPSRFSKGEHHGRCHQGIFVARGSAFWVSFTSTGPCSPSA